VRLDLPAVEELLTAVLAELRALRREVREVLTRIGER